MLSTSRSPVFEPTKLTFMLLQVLSLSSSDQSGRATQVATTTQAGDDQAVSAEEVEDGEAVATTATTILLLPTLLRQSHHPPTRILAPHPGDQVSSLVPQLVRQLATPWEAATTAVLQQVKQARRTGLEEEAAAAARKLDLLRALSGEEGDLRLLHRRAVAGRGMNRPGSAAVAGDNDSDDMLRTRRCRKVHKKCKFLDKGHFDNLTAASSYISTERRSGCSNQQKPKD